jgi:DNA-binding GntR family transcriptional regulator
MTTLAWVAVAEKIRREIVNGKSGPNGELDTEAELCRRFATSRITVRRALAELRADGLITSRRGSGTPTGELVAALRRAGRDEVSKGHWLRLTYGQRANGVLFDEATVWFSPRTVPFVSRQDVAVGPTAKLIEDAGVALGRAIQTVSSDWNERRAQLGEAPQACIDLTLERVMLTADDNIAFVSIHRHRSTLASFRIDLPTTNQHGDAQLILAALSWREETPFEVRSNRVSEAHGE